MNATLAPRLQRGRTSRALWSCLLSTLLLVGCAQQRIRDESQALLRDGQFEQAAARLETGLKDYPDSTLLRAGQLQTRNEALARLLAEAAAARASGRVDEAEAILKRAAAFDSAGKRVDALLFDLATERRQRAALAEAQALADKKQPDVALRIIIDALKDNPRHGELLALQRRLEMEVRQSQVRAAQQGLSETRPISLDFRDASLRTVLDVVSRNSGVNFILDKDIRAETRVTVYLRSRARRRRHRPDRQHAPAVEEGDRSADDPDLSEHAGEAARTPGAGGPRVLPRQRGGQGCGGVPARDAAHSRAVCRRAHEHAGAARIAREHRAGRAADCAVRQQ